MKGKIKRDTTWTENVSAINKYNIFKELQFIMLALVHCMMAAVKLNVFPISFPVI